MLDVGKRREYVGCVKGNLKFCCCLYNILLVQRQPYKDFLLHSHCIMHYSVLLEGHVLQRSMLNLVDIHLSIDS